MICGDGVENLHSHMQVHEKHFNTSIYFYKHYND